MKLKVGDAGRPALRGQHQEQEAMDVRLLLEGKKKDHFFKLL